MSSAEAATSILSRASPCRRRVVLPRRPREVRRAAPGRGNRRAPGPPRPMGSVPAGGVGPALAATTGPGTVPRPLRPRPVVGGRCDPRTPPSAPPPPPDLDCAKIPYRSSPSGRPTRTASTAAGTASAASADRSRRRPPAALDHASHSGITSAGPSTRRCSSPCGRRRHPAEPLRALRRSPPRAPRTR